MRRLLTMFLIWAMIGMAGAILLPILMGVVFK